MAFEPSIINRTLVGQNVVVVTRNMNISQYSQLWLLDHKIFGREDFGASSSFTPGFINIDTKECCLQIQPQGIRLLLKTDNQVKSYECIKKHLAGLIESMGGIPVVAVGVNFLWRVDESSQDMKSLGEYLFGQAESPIYDYFNKSDSRFGAYFSQQFDYNTRLRLDIKPAKEDPNSQVEFLLASFNYHWQLAEKDNFRAVLDHLKKWSEMKQNSQKVVCLLR